MKDYYDIMTKWSAKHPELPANVVNILTNHGIETVAELSTYRREVVERYRGCGRHTMEHLDRLLIRHGLWWGQKEAPARQLAEALREAEEAVRKLCAIIDELNLQIEE